MLPASPMVLVVCAVLVLLATGGLVWAWLAGQFQGIAAQAHVIFDSEDLRYERAWETEVQRQERVAAYGPPLPTVPGQWGGGQ